MLILQGTRRNQKMSGRLQDGSVDKANCLCVRKHVINSQGWSEIKSAKNVFSFVSSPLVYKQDKLRSTIKGWCHPFRNPHRYLPDVPQILLPESDFLDSHIVCCDKREGNFKYDFFYFTVNAKPGLDNKGLKVFFDSLPFFAKFNLRGIVIVYYPNAGNIKRFTVSLRKRHKDNLKKYNHLLTFHWGILKSKEMNEVMQSCRFGFFPNTVDNSPRILAESLIRNVPVLVNKKIHGGWHYVNKNTGKLFGSDNLEESIERMISGKFHASEYYDSNFGFERSSKRLADFLNPIFGFDYSHIYFKAFSQYLENIKS